MKMLPLLIASLLIAANWAAGDVEPDLDDPKVREKILEEAVLVDSLDERGSDGKELRYQAGKQAPYTGWGKGVHANGKLGMLSRFKDGKPEGLMTTWRENGQKETEFNFKDGKLVHWDENGQKQSESHYKDGKEEGLVTKRYPDGQKAEEGHYKDGKKEGLWTSWTGDEFRSKTTANYKGGEQDGPWTSWDKDGQKTGEGHYKDGRLDGLQTSFDKNGKVVSQARFKDGERVE